MDDHARSSLLSRGKLLAVHLLGPFPATVDGVPAGAWHGGRIRSLFAYLLTHRNPWPSREALMDLFWPESGRDAARNSLDVTLHGVRHALRPVTDRPVVVVFRGDRYGLHPEVPLRFDVDQFDEHEGNFQRDDLGRGGAGTDPVDARVYARPVPGTVTMATPVDGRSPVLRLGVVGRTGRHSALDATIVFHEFAHGVTDRLVGGGPDEHALDEPQSAGMGEGWSRMADAEALCIAHVVVTSADRSWTRVIATTTSRLAPDGTAAGATPGFDAPDPGHYRLLGGVIVAPCEVLGVDSGPMLREVP